MPPKNKKQNTSVSAVALQKQLQKKRKKEDELMEELFGDTKKPKPRKKK